MKVFKLILFLLIISSPMMWADFSPLVFRLNAGVGYTIVDLETALEWSWDYFEDWSQLNIKVNLQGLFFHLSSVSLGAEVGYNQLYYYWVRVPYVPSPLTYEGTVSPINISAVGAYSLSDSLEILSSAGVYIFDNGPAFGFKGSLVYRLVLTENMAIPFSLVSEVIFGSGMPVTVGATVGFEYTLD